MAASGASPQQCTPCYEVFAPCSQVDTWSAFAARYRSDESFAASVDAAKNRRCFPGAGYQDMTQQEVTSSQAFVVKLSRKGFLLTKADLKFDQQIFTPAQLKLKNQVSVTTPTGEQHSGFIIADARSSFLEVEVSTTTTVSSHDLVLPRATTTIEDMATLAMKKAMQRSDIDVGGQGKHFLDLLHGKSITLQDLRSRAERAQKLKNTDKPFRIGWIVMVAAMIWMALAARALARWARHGWLGLRGRRGRQRYACFQRGREAM